MRRVRIINMKKKFFNYMINIKNVCPNNIKIDEKSDNNILINYIGYVAQIV